MRWGFSDVVVGLLVVQVVGGIGGLAVLWLAGYRTEDAFDVAPLAILFLAQGVLWASYLAWTWLISRLKGNGLVSDVGLRSTVTDAVSGVAIGVGTQVVLVPLLYIPILLFWNDQDVSEVAQDLVDRAGSPLDTIVLVVLVGVGAPIVEEVFYRGLVLRSLDNRFGSTWAIVLSSVLFGAIHIQLLQFPALALFGAVAAWLTIRTRRLGPAIWAHVGFNLTTVVSLLALG